jgi:hypothetical protein
MRAVNSFVNSLKTRSTQRTEGEQSSSQGWRPTRVNGDLTGRISATIARVLEQDQTVIVQKKKRNFKGKGNVLLALSKPTKASNTGMKAKKIESSSSAVIVDSTQSQTIIRVRVPGEVQPISLTLNESHTVQDLYQAVAASGESGFWELRTIFPSKALAKTDTRTLAEAKILNSVVIKQRK